MKLVLALTLLLCLVISSNAISKKNKKFIHKIFTSPVFPDIYAERPPPNCVWFFDHSFFIGDKDELCIGRRVGSVKLFRGKNDYHSSVKIGADVKAFVYKDGDYKNLIRTIDEDIPNFAPLGFNDQISSIDLGLKDPHNEKYCVRFFRWPNYSGFGSGDRVCYDSSVAKVSDAFGSDHDKQYSSARVGSMVLAVLFSGNNFVFRLDSIYEDTSDFGPLGIDNQVSSVSIAIKAQ